MDYKRYIHVPYRSGFGIQKPKQVMIISVWPFYDLQILCENQ